MRRAPGNLNDSVGQVLAEDDAAIEQFREQVGAPLAGPEFEVGFVAIGGDFYVHAARRVANVDIANDAEVTAIEGIGDAEDRSEAAYDAAFSRAQRLNPV